MHSLHQFILLNTAAIVDAVLLQNSLQLSDSEQVNLRLVLQVLDLGYSRCVQHLCTLWASRSVSGAGRKKGRLSGEGGRREGRKQGCTLEHCDMGPGLAVYTQLQFETSSQVSRHDIT